ncbi:MAG: class I SAM-dependent methyltransferase, partial [Chloroflexales bacterium]|nr:class I SAM-dependent methyltransferase [Chloroflexales bacterium]
LHVSSVARLDMLEPPYDLAIDVGCLHSLNDPDARAYAAGLARLLRPGAGYLLFGRCPDSAVTDGLRGLTEGRVRALFAGSFQVDRVAPGMTTNAVGRAIPSLWLWLTRR